MEWFNVIMGSLSTLVGLVGGGIGIFYWRENKQLKQKEVEAAAIENELKQADAWRALYEQEHERSESKSREKKELYKERDELKEEINRKNFRIEQLCWYHCTVNGCPKRQPPHRFDETGIELAAECCDKV